MNRLPLICILSTCIVVTLAIERFDYDLDCMEYLPEPLEDGDDCTMQDTIRTEQVHSFHHWLHTYSINDDESKDLDNDWKNSEDNRMQIFPTNKSAQHCYCKNTYCQCSGQNLNEVPPDLPHNTKKLDLSRNVISKLSNCTFCNYTHMTYLDLSTNSLTQLQIGSFWGLFNLTSLNLTNNQLLYLNKVFPGGVFSDLTSLRCLKLNRNIPKTSRSKFEYPDQALSDLITLKTLYIDGLKSASFGVNFRNLTELRTLVLGGYREGYCQIVNISKHSFVNVEQISSLDISYCDIHGDASSKHAFEPLVNLNKLDVSCNFNFGVRNLMKALSAVNEYNITTLKMNLIETMFSPSIIIDSVLIRSLPTSLRYLEAQGNNFQSIDQGVLQLLPPNLTYIEAGGNRFLYGEYFKELNSMKSLKILKLNGGLYIMDIPKTVTSLSSATQCGKDNKKTTKQKPLIIQLPPNLLCLGMRVSGLRYFLTELTFDEKNSLESLILTNNYFPSLQGPIKGLHKLKKLFLSDSNVLSMDQSMFRNISSLQELRLRNNKLKNFFNYHSSEPIFRYLKNLKIIDLSYNTLMVVPEVHFKNLTGLEEIDLSQNNIDHFNLTLDNMFNLQKLNLSNSHLSSLPVATRQNIDLLLQTNHSVKVDMSHNPIRCECNNIDFIQWMVNSKAFDPKFTGYICQYEDTSSQFVHDSYAETLRYLTVKCANNTTLFLVVSSVTLCMIFFVIAAVLYRFRWKLRYLYYAAYILLKDRKKLPSETNDFRYDVFIAYAYQDEEFVLEFILPELNQRGLKVLVHGRDFAVGEFIASNIVTAVKESRKTLVVLTRHLLSSTWCHFEIQMANMESVHAGRPVLVFIIKESIPTTEMTSDFLYHLKRNTYIEYPQEETTGLFWDKLARDIQMM